MATTAITKIILRQKSSETLSYCIENVPGGTTISKAVFVVKAKMSDADEDAVITKEIFPGETDDGQITDVGASGTGLLEFLIDNDDVDPLSTRTLYISAVKVWFWEDTVCYQPPYTRRPVRVLPPVIDAVS